DRVVRPAAEAPAVVLRLHRLAHRRPPRVWWASAKLAEPAVAIDATAETSRQSAAAATIWASRNAPPSPWQPSTFSHVRAYGSVVPPPRAPTSTPARRSATWIPPSSVGVAVPWAIEDVPTMPRSWPVAANT